jgi:hypothetical protein
MRVDLIEQAIAAVAHACWCKRMRAAGWRGGESQDAERRTHDAIGEHHRLTAFDREQIREVVRAEALEKMLADAADAALRERELSVRQMRVGLPVMLDTEGVDQPGEAPIGHVCPVRSRTRRPDGWMSSATDGPTVPW